MDAGCANGQLRNPAGVHQNVTPLTSRRNLTAHVCQLSENLQDTYARRSLAIHQRMI